MNDSTTAVLVSITAPRFILTTLPLRGMNASRVKLAVNGVRRHAAWQRLRDIGHPTPDGFTRMVNEERNGTG